jgi:mannose-6-phosphate isomerase-like protein (cupin superfamily)
MAKASVTPIDEHRLSHRTIKYEGRDEIPVSMFLTRYERGEGPDLHLHPYAEVFVVLEGTATFTVGEDELMVEAGHIVVVPPETVHGFKNPDDPVLRVHSVHPSPTVQQTDL